jgi:hypothetical protein
VFVVLGAEIVVVLEAETVLVGLEAETEKFQEVAEGVLAVSVQEVE